jgi:hypothetical protein
LITLFTLIAGVATEGGTCAVLRRSLPNNGDHRKARRGWDLAF